jgi:hypothetical protein
MKKFLLLSLALVVSNVLFAQLPKGLPILVGSSNLGLSFGSTQAKYDGEDVGDKTKTTSFNFSPIAAYTFAENFAAGLLVDYTMTSEKEGDADAVKGSTLMVGPLARYYFPTGGVFPFVHGHYVFGSMSAEGEKVAGISAWGAAVGVDVPVSKGAFVDVSLGYGNTTVKPEYDDNVKVVTGAVEFKVGLMVVLGAK